MRIPFHSGNSARVSAASQLYGTVVDHARQPTFYREFAVPDTLDGRFDMIVLHAALVLRRIRGCGKRADGVARSMLEVLFDDMDRNLRELGVGDLSVGRKVQEMAKAYLGRATAYEKALSEDSEDNLADVLARNLYRGAPPPPATLDGMTDYVREAAAALDSQALDMLCAGRVEFALPRS